MKRKGYVWIAFSLILGLGISFFAPESGAAPPQSKNVKAKIEKKDNEKRKIEKLECQKGDTVSWEATDGDLYLQFMDKDLFGDYNYVVKKGTTLTLELKSEKKGTYFYSIFSSAEMDYVEGSSPPRIIIF